MSRFKKGQSGNPGGKPKELKEIQLEARKLSPTALKTLAHISEHGKSESARIEASKAILDRAFGRPPQALEHSGPDGGPMQLEDVTDDQRSKALKAFFVKTKFVPEAYGDAATSSGKETDPPALRCRGGADDPSSRRDRRPHDGHDAQLGREP